VPLVNPAFEHVQLKVGDALGRLTLDRPDRRNALSLAMMREVIVALDVVAHDDAVRVLVVDGNGPAFSAGHDLSEMVSTREAAFFDELFGVCVEMMEAIHALTQPVIAKVHGVATAAGCQLVAACDLAVAATDARFATPGVNIGLFCSTPMVPISRAIGRKRALEMLLTGEMIDARTAADWGLVNRVVAPDELETATLALAERIARSSAYVVALGKRAFYAQDGATERDAYDITAPIMAENAQHDDAVEGMTAFLEKRAPHWKHN
jgi:enoyl-CoA hydratase/carnithine racemase